MTKAKTLRVQYLPVLDWAAQYCHAIIPRSNSLRISWEALDEERRTGSVTSEWREEMMAVAGIKVQVFHGGRGDPLLVLHGAGGNPGWLHFHAALAEHFHVYAPSHPGFGTSDRPDWIDRLGDLAY